MDGERAGPGPHARWEGDPPLIAGRIHGVRTWQLSSVGSPRLGSPYREDVWPADGTMTAGCELSHGAPAPGCGCGLYALHVTGDNLRSLRADALGLESGGQPDEVLGVLAAWGRVEVHPGGFRAEHGRPQALAVIGRGRDDRYRARVRATADAYGVEFVELDEPGELVAYCEREARGLDPSLVDELVGEPDWEGELSAAVAPKARPSTLRWLAREAWEWLELAGVAVAALIGCVLAGAASLSFAALAIGLALELLGVEWTGRSENAAREQRIEVVEEGFASLDDGRLHVVVVRNDNRRHAALAVRPRGAPRHAVANAPDLPPGETGVVIDFPRPSSKPRDGRPTRMTAQRFVRAPRAAPVRFERTRFDAARCLLHADVVSRDREPGIGVAVVGYDDRGRIAGADTARFGPIPRGRSSQRLYRMPRRPCRRGYELEAYPNLSWPPADRR